MNGDAKRRAALKRATKARVEQAPQRRAEKKERVVESFYSHPWLTIEQRAKLTGAGESFISAVINETDLLDAARMRDVRRVYSEMNRPTAKRVAKALGASTYAVGKLVKKYDPALYCTLVRVSNLDSHCRDYWFGTAKGDGAEAQETETILALSRELKERPFVPIKNIMLELHAPRYLIDAALDMLRLDHFDRVFEREILLAEYIEKNPSATQQDAAQYFNTTVSSIRQIKGSSMLISSPRQPRYAGQPENQSDSGWDCSQLDAEMQSRICLRPSWYVEEVLGRDAMGVELPEEEFNRYLALYEAKRNGRKLYTVDADNRIHWRSK